MSKALKSEDDKKVLKDERFLEVMPNKGETWTNEERRKDTKWSVSEYVGNEHSCLPFKSLHPYMLLSSNNKPSMVNSICIFRL